MSRELDQIHVELQAAGLKPGTPEYERAERERRVDLCKRLRGMTSCWDCDYFDPCALIKAHLRDLYGMEQPR